MAARRVARRDYQKARSSSIGEGLNLPHYWRVIYDYEYKY